jgi:hypothetical protein
VRYFTRVAITGDIGENLSWGALLKAGWIEVATGEALMFTPGDFVQFDLSWPDTPRILV